MKIKLGEMRMMLEGLVPVLTKDLPFKPAYRLGRAYTQLQSEFGEFEKARQKALSRYGERDSNNELVTITDPVTGVSSYKLTDLDAFEAEYAGIIDTEVEINYEPMTIDELRGVTADMPNGVVGETIKGVDLLMLGRLIKEDS